MPHTPGPWHHKHLMIWSADRKLITGMPTDIGEPKIIGQEREANANLMAASPDLLKALIDLDRETSGGTNLCAEKFIIAARAAIAKATGGSHA